ncbi:RsfA family transcriptional regulator [Xylanibacillus composti]|uniref:RsfA family transcriptional regulator n=1 Tax=Xylanibacillus composti TaxID=1572762 RepID=A0A8J4H1R1_9BACL|nr:RsfA family transcriptional regulator [Xylanibacillus composti]MDT9724381.1 RsfA family transcriptional regulator [Xylanibacillus composti]GIQ67975.1 RsfA family transcriptional regulator [Xylanibacillus composti]
MTAVRQDAWTADDDLILAEVTLRHIRDGGTQLSAFEEVGERIGRTAAACGFRWNSCVRKKYEAAIQIAKAQRQKRNQLKRQTGSSELTRSGSGSEAARAGTNAEEQMSMDAIIRFLRQWKGSYQENERKIKQLEQQLADKEEELKKLREEYEDMKQNGTFNEDYKALLQIMERARKMAFLAEEQEEQKPRFKMDANGNLERIE